MIDVYRYPGETPIQFQPVLAEIVDQGDLGRFLYFEVVYHDGERWKHYAGSKTFDDGEMVNRWGYAEDLLHQCRCEHAS